MFSVHNIIKLKIKTSKEILYISNILEIEQSSFLITYRSRKKSKGKLEIIWIDEKESMIIQIYGCSQNSA